MTLYDTEKGMNTIKEYTEAIRYMRDSGFITRKKWEELKFRMLNATGAKELEALYAEAKGTKPQKPFEAKNKNRNARTVICVETGEVFNSIKAAAESNGVIHQRIWDTCNGKSPSVNGLHFEYLEGK